MTDTPKPATHAEIEALMFALGFFADELLKTLIAEQVLSADAAALSCHATARALDDERDQFEDDRFSDRKVMATLAESFRMLAERLARPERRPPPPLPS